jgi:hypothetical protein
MGRKLSTTWPAHGHTVRFGLNSTEGASEAAAETGSRSLSGQRPVTNEPVVPARWPGTGHRLPVLGHRNGRSVRRDDGPVELEQRSKRALAPCHRLGSPLRSALRPSRRFFGQGASIAALASRTTTSSPQPQRTLLRRRAVGRLFSLRLIAPVGASALAAEMSFDLPSETSGSIRIPSSDDQIAGS